MAWLWFSPLIDPNNQVEFRTPSRPVKFLNTKPTVSGSLATASGESLPPLDSVQLSKHCLCCVTYLVYHSMCNQICSVHKQPHYGLPVPSPLRRTRLQKGMVTLSHNF
ncbi:hypothetical protein XENOCAPTIV_021718 [Xenoophorus captivus]|uniref:Uncharacterized protein n=1 Tax=Xenoophorus captivus TaxID=1517983 RepID=A0ABV0RWE2_9TELE